jgi:hypothetical protein
VRVACSLQLCERSRLSCERRATDTRSCGCWDGATGPSVSCACLLSVACVCLSGAVGMLLPNMGLFWELDGSKAERELGVRYTDTKKVCTRATPPSGTQ